MTANCPPQLVSAPLTSAPKYGLYSVATVLDNQDRVGCGVLYVPEAVSPSGFAWKAQCGNAATKQFDAEPDPVTGDGFWVIGGTHCLYDNIEAVVAARLQLVEQRIVEREIWTGSLGLHPEFDASSTPVLSGGGAVSLGVGIGLLEAYIGEHYNGQGVIHSSRKVVPNAKGQIEINNGSPTTLLGTRWVFGQGYSVNTGPGGTAPSTLSQAWVYATGQVVVRRGPIHASTLEQGLNRTTNEVLVIAERPVSVTIDGLLAAVLVDIDA